jgi:4-hydroxybenzoate polyprenyltransferase
MPVALNSLVLWPFRTLRRWGEFVTFSHTVFALPFALAAMAVAARDERGWPGWRLFGLILAAMVCARTCAMAFNRIVDRQFDRENPRTAARPLPSGQISLASAWALCVMSGAGLVGVSYFINPVCFYLSPVALGVVCFYSLTKRFTDFTHVYLGVALALAPIGAWLAVQGGLSLTPIRTSGLLPILLAGAVILWLIGFDIIYAIQDYEFDRRRGLHSLVVRWGVANALKAAFLSHMLMILVLLAFGMLARFRVAYFGGVAIIIIALLFEHWLARKRSLKWVNIAFFRLNALISIIFCLATVIEVAFPSFRVTR